MNRFSSANNDRQIGIEFLPAGVAIAQVHTGKKLSGQLLSSDFLPAIGQQAQARALQEWVQSKDLQKRNCVCLMSRDDFNIHQVEKPKVDDAELIPALTWRIKDLIGYDVVSVVVDLLQMTISNKNNTQHMSVIKSENSTVQSYVQYIK